MAIAPNSVKNLNQLIATIVNIDLETEIIKNDQLGTNGFSIIKTELYNTKEIIKHSREINFYLLPDNLFTEIESKLNQLNSLFFNMKQYMFTNQGERDRLVSSFYEMSNQVFVSLSKASIARIPHHESDFDFKKITDSFLSTATDAAKQIEQMLTDLKDKSNLIGITKYHDIFKTQSEKHKTSARIWMVVSVFAIIITVLYGIGLLYWLPESAETSFVVQFTITKVIIGTVLIYFVTMCVKNYRAEKHNQIINTHRQNALMTFEAFTNGSNDPSTKDQVLLEATHAIFGNQNSGYSMTGESDSDLPSKIIEIIKQK